MCYLQRNGSAILTAYWTASADRAALFATTAGDAMRIQPNALIGDTMRSLGFLSRLPVPDRFFADDPVPSLARSSGAFPLAGLLIALPGAVMLAVGIVLGLPPLIAATLAVAVTVIVTGALHEDGLADVADGFFGGFTIERRLTIMKDSAIGSYGTLALVFAIGLRVALVSVLLAHGLALAIAALLLSASASRAAMVWIWHALPLARHDGAAAASGQPDDDERNLAAALACVTAACIVVATPLGLAQIVLAAVFCATATVAMIRLAREKIDGVTGDVLGATQAMCEIAMLLGLVIAL
jgi:adenosylcobinamide-GDP ribazoletransferase